MDFFSAARPLNTNDDRNDNSSFQQAIFNNAHPPILTARLSPQIIPHSPAISLRIPPPPRLRPSPPQSSAPPQQPPPSRFTTVTPASLPDVLRTPHVLVLDVRPHSAYLTSRLPHALSLSVPSTLLKRPAFSLQKLTTMLSSNAARTRFAAWPSASRILVYDADSPSLADSPCLQGLLRKFASEGFTRDVAWLQGGIQSLWRDHRHLIDDGAVSEDEDDDDNPAALRTYALSKAAFLQSSTVAPTKLPPQATDAYPGGPPISEHRTAANPFYDNIRQNIELSHGITERIPLTLPSAVRARAATELPFPWLRAIAAAAGAEEGTEALAMQFYRIELGEQRRMQGIMAHHSQPVAPVDAGARTADEPPSPPLFPFSITAGVEKGSKNRYRNIWPFEHARVRLQKRRGSDDDETPDDYVNASHVQPLGTRRRYIATQGPLPSTFVDFWTLVWQQNVRVIVMLTREVEGAVAKCARYWASGTYGALHLRLLTSTGPPEDDVRPDTLQGSGGFNFFLPSVPSATGSGDATELEGSAATMAAGDRSEHTIIRRTFTLSHAAHPGREHTVTQLQYMGWPDMNVPEDPHELLRLINEVDRAVADAAAEGGDEQGPVLLHCSAGVGRTGGFIVVDAVLDGLRREIRKRERERTERTERRREEEVAAADESASASASASGNGDDSDMMSVDKQLPADPAAGDYTSPTLYAALRMGSGARSLSAARVGLRSGEESGPTRGGSENSDAQGLVVHVPLMPADEKMVEGEIDRLSSDCPRIFKSSSSGVSTTASAGSGSGSASASTLLGAKTQGQLSNRLLATQQKVNGPMPDFTIADADSMFTSRGPDPEFAKDVGAQARQSPVPAPLWSSDESHERWRTVVSEDESDSYAPGGGRGYSSSSSLGLQAFVGLSTSAAPPPPPGLPRQRRFSAPRQKHRLFAPKALPAGLAQALQAGASLQLQPPHPGTTEALRSSSHVSSSSSMCSADTSFGRSSIPSGSPATPPSAPETSDTSVSSAVSRAASPAARDKAGGMGDAGTDADKEARQPPAGASRAFDYQAPRTLHSDESPRALSTLEEPIRQVLEDMREQRMSLCQSLRQYVFVHRAIIEGALQIAVEERERARGRGEADVDTNGLPSAGAVDTDSPTPSPSPSRAKRGASPTELPKEGKTGEVMLSKRQSTTRKSRRGAGASL